MIETIVLGAIGSLLAAGVIGAGGFFLGKVLGNKQGIQKGIEKGREIEKGEFRKKYETAIHSFSNEIQKLIDQAARGVMRGSW